ncbi:exosortase family protein XrtF [Thalassobellus suaedae]|uniref:Exosortase family protein XrtF n=1 Tax=Thalassobellus suaedae TaxID=3074124 RepID=A0ABY9XYU0_9FLAO|nr:exosortase family protein XrtF [Flavobacteriaceae bacterium HL-DH10]
MKLLFIKYKLIIKFILTFLVVYISFSVLYKFYLEYSGGFKFHPDYMTYLVSKQSEALLDTFGYNAQVLPHPNEPSIKLMVNGKYLARIVEGCNAISVIILFMSFIIAFSGKLRTTFFYILSGSIIIYSVNLLRIAVLSIGLYHYPQHSEFLHTVVFPAIIYGMVFLLWIFWVNRFSKLNNKHE